MTETPFFALAVGDGMPELRAASLLPSSEAAPLCVWPTLPPLALDALRVIKALCLPQYPRSTQSTEGGHSVLVILYVQIELRQLVLVKRP